MTLILQETELAEKCLISEVLYWLALRRLPMPVWSMDGEDYRFDEEHGLRAGEAVESHVTAAECHIAGLPINPRARAAEHDEYYSTTEFYDGMLGRELPDDMRKELLQQREDSAKYAESIAEWDAQFEDYLSYFKSKIFIDLKKGRLTALGARIEGSNISELYTNTEDCNIRINNKKMEQINTSEWVFRKIDWTDSILYCNSFSYCWVNFDVGAILNLYPMPKFPPIGTIWKLGDVYISEADNGLEDSPAFKRGRPSLPWDQFHIEVAALIKANALPEKKEAAIIHFENWFREKLGLAAGRSSIGQRLTPYYNRFIRSPTENTST